MAILPVLPRFLVAAQQEYRVIRSGRDDEQRQQVGRIRRQRDDADVAQEGDDAAGGGHLDRDRDQGEQRGDDGPVDDQQHQPDHPEGQRGDLDVAVLPDRELIGDQRRRAADIGLDSSRRRGVGDDFADGGDGFVGLTAAGVAHQIRLDESGLAVAALRTRRGEWIAPEVLDVLDVFGVGPQLRDQDVGELVRLGAQRRIALENESDQAVGVVLAEHRPDPFGGDQRRRVLGALRHVVDPPDLFQRRDQGVARRGQRQPEDGDRDAELADERCESHPDLSKQKT